MRVGTWEQAANLFQHAGCATAFVCSIPSLVRLALKWSLIFHGKTRRTSRRVGANAMSCFTNFKRELAY